MNRLYQYKAFGVKDYSYNERPQATGYIGKEKDTESNLADHGVRKYDSDLGRFLCPDAIWEKYISYTPYHYCRNNPINSIDFNGLFDIPKKNQKSQIFEKSSPNYKEAYPLFVESLKNAKNFLIDNPSVLSSISKVSKISEKNVLKDFEFGKGPTVFIEPIQPMGFHKNKGEITVNQGMVLEGQTNYDKGKYEQAQIDATVVLFVIIHEYLHDKGLDDDQITKFEKDLYKVGNPNSWGELEKSISNGTITPIIGKNEKK